MTVAFSKTINESCISRSYHWSLKVKGRIVYYGRDLHAADCIHNQNVKTWSCTSFLFNCIYFTRQEVHLHSKSWQSSNGCFFCGYCTNSLQALRLQALTKEVVTANSFVHPECLPSTESFTKFHCLCTVKTTIWINMATEINSVNWD